MDGAPIADRQILSGAEGRKRIISAILDTWNHNGQARFRDTMALTQINSLPSGIASTPITIYRGDADNVWNAEIAKQLHRNLPSSKLMTYGKQGHFAIMHNFQSIIEAIIK
jgi:pimeloyl-ACP methyl ester carboxylesterase